MLLSNDFFRLGSTCNHVAALLFKLDFAWQNGFTNKSCTSRPAEWLRVGKPKLDAKMLKDMEWRKPHYSKAPKPINTAARRLFQPVQGASGLSTLDSLMNALYDSCKDAAGFQYLCDNTMQNYEPVADVNLSHTVDVNTVQSIPPSIPDMIATSHGQISTLTEQEIKTLECATRNQSESEIWKQQRIGRITGSTCHSVITASRKLLGGVDPAIYRPKSAIDRIMSRVQLNPNLPNLKYGREMEPKAKQKYVEVIKYTYFDTYFTN